MAEIDKSPKRTLLLEELDIVQTVGPFKYIRFIVHSLGAVQFVYATFFWVDSSNRTNFGGKFKFLTFHNVVLQATYHGIALLNDIFGSNAIDSEKLSFIRELRDNLFCTLAFPTSHNITLTFWTVYAYDRELIFPRSLDSIFPSWFNHVIHSNVALFTFLDMLTCFRCYPERKSGALTTSHTMVLYVGWLHIARYYNGRWAYQLLNVLNIPMRYLMLSSFIGINIVFYFTGEFLNRVIWAPELRLLEQKNKIK